MRSEIITNLADKNRVGYNGEVQHLSDRVRDLENAMNNTLPEIFAHLATKEELKDVQRQLEGRIGDVQRQLEGKIGDVRVEITAVEGRLQSRIQEEQKNNRAFILKVAIPLFLGLIGLFFSSQMQMNRLEDRVDQRFNEIKELLSKTHIPPPTLPQEDMSPSPSQGELHSLP